MDNPSPQLEAKPPTQHHTPFKNWAECRKFLKKLPNSVPDGEKAVVTERIRRSPQSKHLAFEFLLLIQDRKLAAKFNWLESPTIEMLGDGDEEPDLANKELPSAARTWVFREFDEIRNLDEWKEFLASGRQLWVLLAILKAATNKQVLVESLTAFTECVEHCINRNADGKLKRNPVSANDAEWIAELIKGRIPAKRDLPKTFLDALFAINSTAALGEELRRESNGLRFQLNNSQQELAEERLARETAENRTQELTDELAATQRTLRESENKLEEERLHNVRQGGFNVVARGETNNAILARVRQGLTHRLENIRGYADRENPNRDEIVALVAEIENHLTVLGEEFE